MKRYALLLSLFLTYHSSNAAREQNIGDLKHSDSHVWRIFIDPGHGGKDQGASIVLGGGKHQSEVFEKDITLEASHLLKEWLHQLKTRPMLLTRQSRDRDRYLSLTERSDKANQWQADLYLSLHANYSSDSDQQGIDIYFFSHTVKNSLS